LNSKDKELLYLVRTSLFKYL